MCDFIDDMRDRLVAGMLGAGISPQTAGMVATEVLHEFMRDRAGEVVRISKTGALQIERAHRDRAIIRDFKAGERVPFLARRYGISRVRVWQIIKGTR